MAQYKVQTPDGQTITLEGPDGATDQEIITQAQRLHTPAAAPAAAPVKRDLLGSIAAQAKGALSGLTANFDDEASAGLQSLIPFDKVDPNSKYKSVWNGNSFGDAYKHNVDVNRADQASDEAKYPISRATGSIAGSVAQAALAPEAVTAKLATRPIIGGVIAGGVAGGAAGLGAGDSVKTRLQGMATGAAVGSTLGGVGTAAIVGLGPAVAHYVQAIAGGTRGVTTQALDQITRALSRDGYDVVSPQGQAALQTELARYGAKPVSLADVGANVRARAGVGLRTPSQAQAPALDAVMNRAAGQGPRLEADVRATVAPRTDVHALDDALVQQRADVALPLKRAALQNAAPAPPVVAQDMEASRLPVVQQVPAVVDDPVLQGIARLVPPRILQGAKDAATTQKSLLNYLGRDSTHIPDLGVPGTPLDMKGLDFIKQHLDKEITSSFASGNHNEGAQLRDIRNALRDRMRAASPAYSDYLDQYAGSSDMIEALRAGRGQVPGGPEGVGPGFNRLDPEQIAADQAERSTAGQELYRVGSARNLIDTLRNTVDTRQPAARIINTPEARARLEATGVNPAAAQALETARQQELTMGRLPAETGGSQTAARLLAQRDTEGPGVNIPNPTAPGIIGGVLRYAKGAIDLRKNAAINEQLLPRLVEQDPQAIQQIINELAAAGRTQQASELVRKVTAIKAARATGTVIGAPVTNQEGN